MSVSDISGITDIIVVTGRFVNTEILICQILYNLRKCTVPFVHNLRHFTGKNN